MDQTTAKRPWYLIWLFIPVGFLLFIGIYIISVFLYSLFDSEYRGGSFIWWIVTLLISVILSMGLGVYAYSLIRVIVKKIDNKEIRKAHKISLFSLIIAIIGTVSISFIYSQEHWPYGAIALAFIFAIGLAIAFIASGILFFRGYKKGNNP